MSSKRSRLLNHPLLNGWMLFGWMAAGLSIIMLVELAAADLSRPADVSHMIGFSVKLSIPFIYAVVATSALQSLFPTPGTQWLMRNRKFVGLVFAVAMAWQGLFIAMMSTVFRDYYFEEIFFFRDELEGSTGYIFLTAMVVTSFNFGRRHLSSRQWKLIHRSGMYYLWAYPFAVYWWNLFYYSDPVSLDYVLYWLGFLAVALRIVAWGKKRRLSAVKNGLTTGTPVAAKALGAIFVVAGPIAAATGLSWGAAASDWLTSTEWSATLELWLPFWPFEPFLPLIAMGLGTMLLTVPGSAPAAQATTN